MISAAVGNGAMLYGSECYLEGLKGGFIMVKI
jgi:hypothetical protein